MKLLKTIEKIAPEIQKNPKIHAMWLEGSYATGKFHEKSDIDVWLDVDDGAFEKVFNYFRQKLQQIGDIDREESRGLYSDNPKLAKQTFHLDGFPKEQVIELDLQEHSRKFVFSKNEHTIKVLFDKDQTINWG